MASDELDALVHALSESDGFPVPTAEEFAERVLQQLGRLGYAVVRVDEGTVDGIRPHLPWTPEEDALARKIYEQMPGPDLVKLLRELES